MDVATTITRGTMETKHGPRRGTGKLTSVPLAGVPPLTGLPGALELWYPPPCDWWLPTALGTTETTPPLAVGPTIAALIPVKLLPPLPV